VKPCTYGALTPSQRISGERQEPRLDAAWTRWRKNVTCCTVSCEIAFESGSRLEKVLRRRAFLGPDAFVLGEATTGGLKMTFEALPIVSHL
jgi:hypothetical protein